MVKKGFVFSLDALIAVLLIISVLLVSSSIYLGHKPGSQPHYYAADMVQLLSSIKVGDISDPEVIALLNSSNITDANKTISEQVLRYQVAGDTYRANMLLNLTLGSLLPSNYEMGIWIEGYDEPIFNTSSGSGSYLISSKQLVSGMERDKAIEGLTSRAFLTGISEQVTTSYVYFGGYEGDGNLTKMLELPESLDDITEAVMELDNSAPFSLYVNGAYSGYYPMNDSSDVQNYTIDDVYLSNFLEGSNNITLLFNGTSKYVGGGYLKVKYLTDELLSYDDSGVMRYNFPGIDGLINLYSSFYVPGTIQNMSIFLHTLSEYYLFLSIGEDIVYNYNLTGNTTLSDQSLRLTLDYSSLSNTTVPLRFGLVTSNLSGIEGRGGKADIILITDLSRSMYWRLDSDVNGTERNCSDPQLYNESTSRLSLARCLDQLFVDAVLEGTENRVGLAAFYGLETGNQKAYVYQEALTANSTYLNNKINQYTNPSGGTCVCCAINTAYEMFSTQSNSSRMKFLIVMSDGVPTHDCANGVFKASWLNDLDGKCRGNELIGQPNGVAGCFGDSPEDCTAVDCACASYNANYSSCRVHNQFNATVHSIGFGPVGSCQLANDTLNDIADCGDGNYYSSSNATALLEIYQYIASQILNVTFRKQSAVIIEGNVSRTILYPDSYISFNYTPQLQSYEYGRIPVVIEKDAFGNNITNGTFEVPAGTTLYDAYLTSYSGDKWTDRAKLGYPSGNVFYNLSTYGDIYEELGDPFIINIPINIVSTGNNSVYVATGLNPRNETGGSVSDRIVYTLGINVDVNYTGVFERADGCLWTVWFEDNSSTTLAVPESYGGAQNCTYDPSTDCNNDYFDDAIDNSICHLFESLDINGDGKLFFKFGADDISIETFSIGKIPYLWGPTTMEVRVWR